MDLQELVARESIRDSLHRYTQCADGGRFDELVALFAPDAVFEVDGTARHEGREAIRSTFDRAAAHLIETGGGQPTAIRHHATSIVIDLLDDDHARTTTYWLAVMEGGPDHWGRYRDRFERIDGRWLIAHRRVTEDGHVSGSWAAHGAEWLVDE
jgi:ketosteroid isomerase-like protein